MTEDLNARQRKHVHMSSSIFNSDGPSSQSLYEPGRQQELYNNLKTTLSYVNKAAPDLSMPSPAAMKCSQNAGHSAVISSTGGHAAIAFEKRDQGFIPKEFWETSVGLQWHDVRNQLCRDKAHERQRQPMGAKELKRNELSSELFNRARMTEASTTAARSEIMAETADYLQVDSALHARGSRQQPSAPGDRYHANLATSNTNTMQRPEAPDQAAPPSYQKGQDYSGRPSNVSTRNYSDLFGAEMGMREPGPTERQDVTQSQTCSFLDARGEIAARRKDHWQPNAQMTSKTAEMNSSLFGNKSPGTNPDANLQQMVASERGCWESKECLQISSEISRRRREKDFRQDFNDQHGLDHQDRKQKFMSSAQVHRNLGSAVPQALSAASRPNRFLSPREGSSGAKPIDREQLLQSAKDTKLASLQSSIFS
mmetsp:Transcript_14315/g.25726  ORF Transcript_14315/g.25726 Transcript_14315/m.25726 type:complete len:425 (+) Transcript_14315:83-1357(+)|eukprot:CAMPEP_0115079770 /NCGR_PEP_ID=MMETSP0227-20121206/18296_1 /TAXON_ID=89957 /ORGANISM="Polarella glacialis, Strain CCMP 1383" /LENGTH=424 /DNA_ID=CAMNT_0002467317 /DNA_START=51 /DNA_END=1325 /DNA_ORIENTATION=+